MQTAWIGCALSYLLYSLHVRYIVSNHKHRRVQRQKKRRPASVATVVQMMCEPHYACRVRKRVVEHRPAPPNKKVHQRDIVFTQRTLCPLTNSREASMSTSSDNSQKHCDDCVCLLCLRATEALAQQACESGLPSNAQRSTAAFSLPQSRSSHSRNRQQNMALNCLRWKNYR